MTMSFWTDELSEVRTHKKEFLEQMDRLVPWGEWVKKIQPHYYKGERGNKPYDLELMLRIYVLQNVYSLADMAVINTRKCPKSIVKETRFSSRSMYAVPL